MWTMGVASCPTNAPEFVIRARPYTTDYETQSLIRGNKRIRSDSPEFEGRICITIDEYARIYSDGVELINKCERWKP